MSKSKQKQSKSTEINEQNANIQSSVEQIDDQLQTKPVIILGYSKIKDSNKNEILRKLLIKCKFYVHISLVLKREKPDNFIIHTISARSPEILAKSAVDLAATLKNETLGVIISNIIIRADKQDTVESL